MKRCIFPFTIVLAMLAACHSPEKQSDVGSAAKRNIIPYQVVTTYQHNQQSFTEGLVIHDGKIYESTGSNDSWVGEINPATGSPTRITSLPKQYFGEGIAIWNHKVYELTWKNKVGFIYDLATFNRLGEFHYNFEGWGLTHDDHHLIASDGTDKLYYLDTTRFEVAKTLHITENNAPVNHINELEYVNGMIYANQWETNYLLKIDPDSQMVVGKLDLSALTFQAKQMNPDIDVLNGVAYDQTTGNLLVTGKYWPLAFVIHPD